VQRAQSMIGGLLGGKERARTRVHETSGNRPAPPARQVVATVGEPNSEQAQSQGPGEPLLDLLWVEPGTGEGIADKADRRLHPER